MKKFSLILLVWTIQIIFGVSLYFAAFRAEIWAKNIVTFYIYVLFFMSLFSILSIFTKKDENKFPKAIPRFIGIPWNIAIILVMAAKGWMLLASFFLISWLISYFVAEIRKRKE